MSALKILFLTLSTAFSFLLQAEPGKRYWTWDGFYIGLNGGLIQSYDKLELSSNAPDPLKSFLEANGRTRLVDWNVIGGGQIGFNYQWCGWLFGLEADGNYLNLDGHRRTAQLIEPISNDRYIFRDKVRHQWLVTARGRVGWIMANRLLWYLTGGYATGDAKVSASILSPTNTFFSSASDSKILHGWTFGGGAEYALTPRFSIKGEYLYVHLGHLRSRSAALSPFSGLVESRRYHIREDVVRFGINYLFL